MTTVEQRVLWQQLHYFLAEYLINYGPIQITTADGNKIMVNDTFFISCGKIEVK